MRTFDMISATPNTVEAIRKAHAIRKDLRPDGSYQYSFPSSKPLGYNGMWKVEIEGNNFKIPAFPGGNLILTEDRLLENVTETLLVARRNYAVDWLYLEIGLYVVYPVVKSAPVTTSDYLSDFIPLAMYSQETGLVQLQYGPVRSNRYWLRDDDEN